MPWPGFVSSLKIADSVSCVKVVYSCVLWLCGVPAHRDVAHTLDMSPHLRPHQYRILIGLWLRYLSLTVLEARATLCANSPLYLGSWDSSGTCRLGRSPDVARALQNWERIRVHGDLQGIWASVQPTPLVGVSGITIQPKAGCIQQRQTQTSSSQPPIGSRPPLQRNKLRTQVRTSQQVQAMVLGSSNPMAFNLATTQL
jgi:hypothetical protein